MVTLSPVTTPQVNINQNNREQAAVREDTSVRERLGSTKPSGASLSKTDSNNSQKNYRQSQDFADARLPDPSSAQGNRRGSLLDLTV